MANTTIASTKTNAFTTTMSTAEQQAFLSTAALSTSEQQSPSLEATYENRLQAALEHARRLTQMYGCQGVDVAIAWETVEELRTSSRRVRSLPSVPSCQTAFERYCTENPRALECRSYDC